MTVQSPKKATPARSFRLVSPEFVPANAMSRDPRIRREECRAWRFAVMQKFTHEARPLKLAWLLESLSVGKGYAFPSDAALAGMAGLNVDAIYLGLRALEQAGFIARVHVVTPSGSERRLFLLAVDPVTHGVGGSPSQHAKRTPPPVGTEEGRKLRTPTRTRVGARDDARLAAENRERGVTFQSLMAEDEARGGGGRA